MHHRAVVWALGWALLVPGCSTNRCVTEKEARSYPHYDAFGHGTAPLAPAEPAPAVSPQVAAIAGANPATPPPAASGSPLEQPDADTHAVRGLSGTSPRQTVTPNMTTIPSPPATLSVSPNAGVEATLKSMPAGIPLGHLSKEILEGPLRDPARFAGCRKNQAARIQIDAVIYNGVALGVNVKTTPNDRALGFCVERIVRETSWVKELAVNRVTVSM